MRITQRPSPPTGWKRRVLRMPVTLYRWHLGALLGHRFVLVEHVGRRSGKTRQVVLEVVDHDEVGHGAPDGWIVAAGYGTTSDWYRNLTAHPRARVQVGRRRSAVEADFLGAEEGGDLMAHYGRVHRKIGVRLCKSMGFDVDGSEADFREAGRNIRFVWLRPVHG
ncbi:nitroreductase family deazaflavin-dependent oxidoreductase [Prescottella agglutinans]|uniref:Nitroreductase family deazaflavin-dependent oxidoreductase n=1 Tax=Prescottella agglutinans TaxID=1644129 RepID=A0A438B9L3_9NOCA|nr:nitroreductase family deazaflavin-dependent oxidoreductase [Prescottella agglutinans]RVW07674.1 nitroreductase family deazaflavin-dependent oxidoreductase [Prescottella agglutinans]